VGDTYFMSYHTTLKKSSDWYESMRAARLLSEKITHMINTEVNADLKVEVFPYR
jgi:Niemann-Pick C1 protein